jgi:heme oxygenase
MATATSSEGGDRRSGDTGSSTKPKAAAVAPLPLSCPYAVALEDDEQSQPSVAIDHYLVQAKQSCPAFAEECPFANAKSPQDLRQALSKVPQSHYKETYFREAIQHLHLVGPKVDRPEFQLAECPVSTYMKEQIPFAQAMEAFSLATIMSRMARDIEREEEQRSSGADATSNLSSDGNLVSPLTAAATTTASTKNTDSASATEPMPTTTTTTSNNADTPRLSQAFKSGTAVAHQAAEDVHFVKNFVQGKIDRSLYADMILALFHVYAKLELLLEQHAATTFPNCHFPFELNRTAALQEDLDFWFGSTSSSSLTMSPATRDYVDRLDAIAATNPILLLAHAYTRYLGDLSGGKVLARVARRALNLGKKDGLAFYDFENIPSAKVFKDKYRKALDTLNLTANQVQELVQEANVAFLLNMRLFEELDVKANVPGAKVRDLNETLNFLQVPPSASSGPVSEECPFLVNKKQDQPTTGKGGGRCPWPFVFFHDPLQGMQDYQTWIVVGLILCWVWSYLQRTE